MQTPAHNITVPPDFVELPELRSVSLDLKLGYFGQQRFVIVGYSDGGQEIYWKDGLSSGFGLGHWQYFLDTLAPLAARRGIHLGALGRPGTHVVVLDRERKATYATCRNCAETFLAQYHGTDPPIHRCLCRTPHP
jgi:hypothetical protein